MNILDQPLQAPIIDGDPFEVAERLMDLLFPYFSDYEPLDLRVIINKSNLCDSDKKLARYLKDKIEILMYSKLFYADKRNLNSYNGCLTPLGRHVKSFGGHKLYLDKLRKQREEELIRQSLSDKKLLQDLINAEFEGKQGRKIKRWTLSIAIATFILSLGGSTIINKFLFLDNVQIKKNDFKSQINDSITIKSDTMK